MQLGIGSYSYGWASGTFASEASDAAQRAGFALLSANDLIDKAVQLDVPVVQLCVLPDLTQMDNMQLNAIRAYAEDTGRTLEIGTASSDPDHLRQFLHIAQVLDARLVRTIFPNASEDLVDEGKSIAQVVDLYADAQVYLAIENYETASFVELRSLCEVFDNEYLVVCLDTLNNLGRGEGVGEVTTALMPYTKCLHVKDFTVVRHESNTSFSVIGAPAGEGTLDLYSQMALLNTVHPDASIVLEQWTPAQGRFEDTVRLEEVWAVKSIRNMKAALAQVEGS